MTGVHLQQMSATDAGASPLPARGADVRVQRRALPWRARLSGGPALPGIVVLAAILWLAGCAPLERAPEAPDAPAPETRPPASAEEAVPEPVGGLLADAEQASAAGEHERAAALLERALGIAPDNAVLWHNLAIVRYRQGAHGQAEQMALRAAELAGGDERLQAVNWRLIAAAREARGDAAGAEEASTRALRLQSGE